MFNPISPSPSSRLLSLVPFALFRRSLMVVRAPVFPVWFCPFHPSQKFTRSRPERNHLQSHFPTLARLPFSPFSNLLPLSTHNTSPPISGVLNPNPSTNTRASLFASQKNDLHVQRIALDCSPFFISSFDPRLTLVFASASCARRFRRPAVGRLEAIQRDNHRPEGSLHPCLPPKPPTPGPLTAHFLSH